MRAAQQRAPQLDTPEDTRERVSKYAENFVVLARRCEMPIAAERIEKANRTYDKEHFNLVVTSGKKGVGKSQVICGLVAEPELLPEDTRTVYKILNYEVFDEPLEDLADLMGRGYYELTVPVGMEQSTVSGKIVSETQETVTLTVTIQLTLPKSPPSTIVTFDNDKETVGWIKSERDGKILLKKIDGTTEEIDTLDIKGKSTINFVGKRKRKYTVLFKRNKQEFEKQIDPRDAENYVDRDDVKCIVIRLHNDFFEKHSGTTIVDTPHLEALLADEERSLCLLSARAFLFVLDGLMKQEEKETLASLSQITKSIYFVQTKIDTYTDPSGWKQQRRRNLQEISEVLDIPPQDIKYFSVSAAAKKKADQAQDSNVKKKALKDSGFSQLLEFLEGKLEKTDEKRNNLSREFLKKLKYETETLLLHVGLNSEELAKFENWFNTTYETLKKDFDKESEDILWATEARINEVFGSPNYRPITLKVMSQFDDMDAEQLRSNLYNIQQKCVNVCTTEIKHILDFYIKQNDQSRSKMVKRIGRPGKGMVESPTSKLSIYFVEKLSQLYRSHSEGIQSFMYPLMIGSGALQSLFAASASSGPPGWLVGGGAVLAFGLWGIARYFKARETEIMQKEKTAAEIKQILNGIVEYASIEVNRELKKLIQDCTTEMQNDFESWKKEADEKISSDKGISKSQELQIRKDEAETLLKNIDRELERLI